MWFDAFNEMQGTSKGDATLSVARYYFSAL